MLDTHSTSCPYCGEPIELVVDASVDEQEYIEDCQVCCRPMVVHSQCAGGELIHLEVRDENS